MNWKKEHMNELKKRGLRNICGLTGTTANNRQKPYITYSETIFVLFPLY